MKVELTSPTESSGSTNMAAFSTFGTTNMAAMKSRANDLYLA